MMLCSLRPCIVCGLHVLADIDDEHPSCAIHPTADRDAAVIALLGASDQEDNE